MVRVQRETEIAIIGAGPAGAFTALNLAKLGLAQKVAVFEEHDIVGRPSHCAGHLNIKSLNKLGIRLPEKVIENRIRGARFYSPNGLSFEVKRESPVTLVVNRELFDQMIAREAEKLGVMFRLNCRVRQLLVEAGKVDGLILHDRDKDEDEVVCSKVVVDAEGCPATLLKKAGFPCLSPKSYVYGGQAEIDEISDVELDMVEVYLGRKFAPGFFAWIIPRQDGTAKVGLAVKYGNPKRHLLNFIRKHPIASKKLHKSRIVSLSFHPIPLGGPISKTYGNGLLVVGDAASQVKPTTGGGVITGMICAEIAAKTILKALNLNDFSERVLAEYQRAWTRRLGFEFKVMLRLRKMLDRLSDRRIDKLFEFCIKTGLNETLEKVGDVDWQGRTLLRAALNPKGLIPLLYLVWSALTEGELSAWQNSNINR